MTRQLLEPDQVLSADEPDPPRHIHRASASAPAHMNQLDGADVLVRVLAFGLAFTVTYAVTRAVLARPTGV